MGSVGPLFRTAPAAAGAARWGADDPAARPAAAAPAAAVVRAAALLAPAVPPPPAAARVPVARERPARPPVSANKTGSGDDVVPVPSTMCNKMLPSIGMSHAAESTCCSSIAFERPNESTQQHISAVSPQTNTALADRALDPLPTCGWGCCSCTSVLRTLPRPRHDGSHGGDRGEGSGLEGRSHPHRHLTGGGRDE
jgi:hypothetical protein